MARTVLRLLHTLILCCSGLLAQSVHGPLKVADVLSQALMPASGGVALSHDGQWLAYTVQLQQKGGWADRTPLHFSETGSPAVTVGSSIWLVNTKTPKPINLIPGPGTSWGPSWSPDGRYLAFYSDRAGRAQLWVYDANRHITKRISDVIVRPLDEWQTPCWSRDSSHILIKVLASGDQPPRSGVDRAPLVSVVSDTDNENGSRVLVYRSTGDRTAADNKASPGLLVRDLLTQAERANLALVDVENGKLQTVATGFTPIWYSMSPTNSSIAFATLKGLANGEVYQERIDLFVAVPNGKLTMIASDISANSRHFRAAWSPDGRLITYVAASGEGPGECYIASVAGGVSHRATRDSHPAFSPLGDSPIWDARGTNVYVVASDYTLWTVAIANARASEVTTIPNHKIYAIVGFSKARFFSPEHSFMIVNTIDDTTKEAGFYRIDLTDGSFLKLKEENKDYNPSLLLSAAGGQTIVYLAEDSAHPPNFVVSDADFTNSRQLTDTNPQMNLYSMGKSRLIEWRSDDGDVLHGALLLPADYDQNKRYPLIVELYPAFMSGCLNQFGLCGNYYVPNKQLFATRGYAVLFPDAPMGVGTFMADLVKTVLPGVNKVIELGIADPDRLGLMGQSWGGYSTLALIVQTSRFKAAAMLAGTGDLMGLYGEMDETGSSLGVSVLEGDFGRHMPGTPWEYRSLYVENSPVFYLDRVHTPLMIINGTKDTNVAPFLGDEVFVSLRRLQKQVVYAKYLGEGHVINDYDNQVDCIERLLDWFDKHLGSNHNQ